MLARGKNAERIASSVAIAAALVIVSIGYAYGTFAAGGSDSSCYLSEARLLASGRTGIDEPLARTAPWPAREASFAPAGHLPSSLAPGVMVPICPPGLPLTMAAARAVGVSEWLIVPILGGVAVWLTFVIGRRIDGEMVGASAAVLTAVSPIFLCQLTQPMTDVPAAAWWLLVVVLASGGRDGTGRPFAAGLAASIAILTRPNLLPLAFIVAAYLAWAAAPAGVRARARRRVRAIAMFGLGVLPGIVVLGALQQAMFGSPLASGYGSLSGMFAASHVLPNLQRYPRWLIETQTPLLALALAAPAVCGRDAPIGCARIWLCLAVAAATLVCYLPYLVFEDWWYIRFLLPAIPLLIVPSVVVLRAVLQRAAPAMVGSLTVLSVAGLALWCANEDRARLAFRLRDLEHHYVEAGTFVAERLPPRAALVTLKYSGSVRYYAGRPGLSWDTLDPAWLDRAITFLRDRGYEPYLLLGTDEEPTFKERFSRASVIGSLDWPPVARIGRLIRVYDPNDRARYLRGEDVRTEDVWSAPARQNRR